MFFTKKNNDSVRNFSTIEFFDKSALIFIFLMISGIAAQDIRRYDGMGGAQVRMFDGVGVDNGMFLMAQLNGREVLFSEKPSSESFSSCYKTTTGNMYCR